MRCGISGLILLNLEDLRDVHQFFFTNLSDEDQACMVDGPFLPTPSKLVTFSSKSSTIWSAFHSSKIKQIVLITWR